MNFLLPSGFGEGWGGVKNLRLLQELLYQVKMLGFLRQAVPLIYQVIDAIYLPAIVWVLLIN